MQGPLSAPVEEGSILHSNRNYKRAQGHQTRSSVTTGGPSCWRGRCVADQAMGCHRAVPLQAFLHSGRTGAGGAAGLCPTPMGPATPHLEVESAPSPGTLTAVVPAGPEPRPAVCTHTTSPKPKPASGAERGRGPDTSWPAEPCWRSLESSEGLRPQGQAGPACTQPAHAGSAVPAPSEGALAKQLAASTGSTLATAGTQAGRWLERLPPGAEPQTGRQRRGSGTGRVREGSEALGWEAPSAEGSRCRAGAQ